MSGFAGWAPPWAPVPWSLSRRPQSSAGGLEPEHSPSPCSAPGHQPARGQRRPRLLLSFQSSPAFAVPWHTTRNNYRAFFFYTNYKGISQIGEFCVSHSENASDEIAVKGIAAQGAPGIGLGSPARPSPALRTCSREARAARAPGARCWQQLSWDCWAVLGLCEGKRVPEPQIASNCPAWTRGVWLPAALSSTPLLGH